MFASNVIVVVALALLGLASAQVIYDGACPSDVEVVPDFNVEKFLGTWYEHAKYPVFFEAEGKCVTAKYGMQENGDVSVVNSMINEISGEAEQIDGVAKYISNGKLQVTFSLDSAFDISGNYWVLDTDYSSYGVVYSCQPLDSSKHAIFAWILTREREVTDQLVSQAENVLTQNGISPKELVKTNQSDCN